MNKKYDDIINLTYNKSDKRPHMSNYDRAAQFSPFSALTGHDLAIRETARITDEKKDLDDSQKEQINRKINYIQEHIKDNPQIVVTYFLHDKYKNGGKYVKLKGKVKMIDEYQKVIKMVDNKIVSIEDIFDIESELFKFY